MIDETQIMPLNFFAYGGIYSGQHGKMRYRMERAGEKPDFTMNVCCWRGPYSYDSVMRDEATAESIKRASFSFDEDGRKEAIVWLLSEYDSNRQFYGEAPEILDAAIDLSSLYGQKQD
jgi:hypothetical protein